jgi:hypothetical protein
VRACTAIVSAGGSNTYTCNEASRATSPYLFLPHSCTAIPSAGEQAARQKPMLLFPSRYLPLRVGISIHTVAIQCLAYPGQDVKYLTCPTESAEHGDLEPRLEEPRHILPFSVPTSVRVSSAVFWEVLLFGFRSTPCSALFCKG